MGQSGNPAKKAASKKTTASNVQAFKKRKEGVLLDLPSGLTVQAKKVELQTFIRQGNIPNPLMNIVSEALEKGKKADVPKMMGVEDGEISLDMVNDMYEMVNAVVVSSIVVPKVHSIPSKDDVEVWNTKNPDGQVNDSEELRDDDLLYVDEVDDEDKMFIFQWASGGTADIARFREEARADMDALAKIQGSGSTAE